MRRIVVTEEVSLDGVMENPTWSATYWNDGITKFKSEEMVSSDALLMGRVTYESLAGFWPNTQEEGAEQMNSIVKYVVSTTLAKADWNNSHIIKDNVVEEIKKLKQQDGKDILVYGSSDLIQTLIQHDLIDSYRLVIYPVVAGKGKRIFQEGTTATLKLISAEALGGGVAGLVYEPERK